MTNNEKIKIIFMGTSQFGVPALELLLTKNDFEVVAIYSKEPQIAGRGHKIQNSPIHELALKHNLKIITPKTLKNPEVQKEFTNFKADIAVVVAYGLLLPKEILNAPKFGCINIHPSLLPRWRGAAPIQRAIMAGDLETGVDIIKMNEGLDSGDILAEEKIPLYIDISYFDLAKKLSEIGAELLVKTIKNIVIGNANQKKQDDELAVYATKILKEEFEINWNDSVIDIHNKIRALSGCGSAYFILKGEKIKIHKAKIISKENPDFNAGDIIDDKLTIACKDGLVRPEILQRAGKNKVTLEEFLRGFSVN